MGFVPRDDMLQAGTRYIPLWVKVCVAIALDWNARRAEYLGSAPMLLSG